jgi:hypothetical protein
MPCQIDVVDLKRGGRASRKGYKAWKASLAVGPVEVLWEPIVPLATLKHEGSLAGSG